VFLKNDGIPATGEAFWEKKPHIFEKLYRVCVKNINNLPREREKSQNYGIKSKKISIIHRGNA